MRIRQIKKHQVATPTSTSDNVNLETIDFAKMRIGLRTLEDAILDLKTSSSNANPRYTEKEFVLNAIKNRDYRTLRDMSDYYFNTNGIYRRSVEYLAFLFRYDWYLNIHVDSNKTIKEKNIITKFNDALKYFDNSEIKKAFNNIALEVVKKGCYYAYVLDLQDKFVFQQLPVDYCRSRFFQGSKPVVEFNLKFFDDKFRDADYRVRVLKTFPKEIQKAYMLYKSKKLVADPKGDEEGWYLLDPASTIKFNLNDNDMPTLISSIPSLIDLDQAQELDRKKMMQQLLKILIQKLPIDKNGELMFDVDEAKDIHENAVAMLRRAIGLDVLTTFADVEVQNMQDKNSVTTTDDLKKVERSVFNNTGLSQNLFNTEGNIALQKSILNDEAIMKDLVYQFRSLLNKIVKKFNEKNFSFSADILETTIDNYKDLSKMYKEQVQIGNSKILPQIALGHSQSSIIDTAYFENEILHLADIMVPPRMSSTMSSKDLQQQDSKTQKQSNTTQIETSEIGRPEKDDNEKSEKTIANRESSS